MRLLPRCRLGWYDLFEAVDMIVLAGWLTSTAPNGDGGTLALRITKPLACSKGWNGEIGFLCQD